MTSSGVTQNERQHFVPQFYLRQWVGVDGKGIWAYPLDGSKPFETSPKAVAAERAIYRSPQSGDLKDFDTERSPYKFESVYAPVWPSVFERAAALRTRRNLARFVALMVLRHPDSRSLSKTAAEIVCGRDVVRSSKDLMRHAFIDNMRGNTEWFTDIFMRLKWGVICTEAPFFVTSDTPVVLWRGTASTETFGFGTPGTEISFPISPTRLLLLSDRWDHEFACYPLLQGDDFNRGTIKAAMRFAFFTGLEQRICDLVSQVKGLARGRIH